MTCPVEYTGLWHGMGEVCGLGTVDVYSLKEEIGRVTSPFLKLETKEVTRMTNIL